MGEGFEAGGAVLGLIHFAGAKAVQQRAQNAPHMRVVVDDQKAQPVEIDTDHANSRAEGAKAHLRTVKR